MTDMAKALGLLIKTCELLKDYEEKKLTKDELEQRADAIMDEVVISYNNSDKKDDPEIKRDYEELVEQHKKFKEWIKTSSDIYDGVT